MTNVVRAKFTCNIKTTTEYSHGESTSIELSAVTTGSDEDKKFWEATPSGSVKMEVLNPEAAKFFKPGKTYYVSFSEATE